MEDLFRSSGYDCSSRVVSKQQEVYGDLFRSSGYDCSSRVVALKLNPSLPSVVSELMSILVDTYKSMFSRIIHEGGFCSC